MILVWRICADCGRRFSFWRKPGEAKGMPKVCPDCDGSAAHVGHSSDEWR